MDPLELLLHTVENLKAQELKKFQLFLTEGALGGFDCITKGKLENCNPTDTAGIMREAYGSNGSLRVTLLILKKLQHNNLAEKLEKELEKRATPPSQTQVSTTAQIGAVSAPLKDHKPGQDFFSKHKADLEIRLPDVLSTILIQLVQKEVLKEHERETVETKVTSVERNRALLKIIEKRGGKAQQVFYEVIKEADKWLVMDLEEKS